jgi:hypothetical protein
MFFRFHAMRVLRKAAKMLGYRIDYTPQTFDESRVAKASYLASLAKRTAHLEGDIVECGLGHGFSFGHLAKVAHESNKRLFGFDSFEGFPAPSTKDRSSYSIAKGDWGEVDIREVMDKVSAVVPETFIRDRVIVTPGFFSDTLGNAPIHAISFLHLDGDLYQSYIDCYNVLYDKVVPGGIIALDEYLSGIEYSKYPGGFSATKEFLQGKHADVCRDITTGKYYIIKYS